MIFALFGTKFCRGIGVGKMGCSDAYECIEIGCEEINLEDYCISWLSFPPSQGIEDISSPSFEVCPSIGTNYVLNAMDDEGNIVYTFYYNVDIKGTEVTIYPRNPVICEGVNTTTLRLDTDYVTYIWSNGDDAQEIQVSQSGEYSVTVVDDSGCEMIGEVKVADVTNDPNSILDFFESSGFVVLPIIEAVPAFHSSQDASHKLDGTQENVCDIVLNHAVENVDYVIKEDYLLFEEDEPQVDLINLLSTNCEDLQSDKLILTDNGSFCQGDLLSDLIDIYDRIEEFVIWVHIYREGDENYLILGHNDSVKKRLHGIPELSGFIEDLPEPGANNTLGCSRPSNTWHELNFAAFDELAESFGRIRYTNYGTYVQRLGRIFEDAVQRHLNHNNKNRAVYQK
jgi:hypothetical protein